MVFIQKQNDTYQLSYGQCADLFILVIFSVFFLLFIYGIINARTCARNFVLTNIKVV